MIPALGALAALGSVAGTAVQAGVQAATAPKAGFNVPYDPNSPIAKVNPGSFEWGGKAGMADADTERARQAAAAAQGRQYGMDFRNDTRGLVGQLQGLMGPQNMPSAAQAQLQAAKDQTMAQQMAMAAGARGSGALAGAQQAAMMNAGQATQQAGAQSAQLRAQEAQAEMGNRLQAAGLLGQTLNQGRGLDLQQAGQNDAMTMFYEKMGFDTRAAQLMAQQQREKLNLDAWNSSAGDPMKWIMEGQANQAGYGNDIAAWLRAKYGGSPQNQTPTNQNTDPTSGMFGV